MFKNNKEERKIENILKDLMKASIVIKGLKSKFSISVENKKNNKFNQNIPEIELEGTSVGILVGISLLVKEVRNKYDVTNEMIDEIIEALEKGEVTEEEFFKIKKQENKK